MSKSHYVQAIVTCLESANEKQAKLICTFVSNYMKKTELKMIFGRMKHLLLSAKSTTSCAVTRMKSSCARH